MRPESVGYKSSSSERTKESRKPDLDAAAQDAPASPASVTGAAGLALLAAATLDGVPENLVLGVALGEGSAALRSWPPFSSPISPKRWWVAPRCAFTVVWLRSHIARLRSPGRATTSQVLWAETTAAPINKTERHR